MNIGDIVQVWSNDRYTAALHRGLVSADAERFSAPFFFNPAYSTEYAPLPSTVDAQHPPRYRPINWGEFRARRAAGDYADHGEYHSISHYSRLSEGAPPWHSSIRFRRAGSRGEAFAMYDRQQKHYGYVPNYATVFCHRPEIMRRWGELQAAIKRPMDKRRFELVTFAAAHALRSTLCTLAHGKALLAFFSAEDVMAMARGETPASLSAAEAALMRFARAVARDASAITAADVAELKGTGSPMPRCSTSRPRWQAARSSRKSSSRSAWRPMRRCASDGRRALRGA